jgi:glycosyltransferase involved in cell wall biosynthesis
MVPRVSFLLPVHNHVGTVGATVESVLGQTMGDMELIVIDDASMDGSAEVLRRFKDSRMRVHRNEVNLELTRSLNVGLAMARGEFVARIDADDLCLPQRAEIQLAFLDAQPHIAVTGSYIETMSENAEPLRVVEYPHSPNDVAAAFLFRNPIAHPAVMFRRELLARHGLRYDETFRRGQDFDLWVRCILSGLKLANVPQVLTRYRVHATQVSQRDSQGVRETGARVRKRLIRALGISDSQVQSGLHEQLAWDELQDETAWLTEAVSWLELLYRTNQATGLMEADALGRTLCGRWVKVLRHAKSLGLTFPTQNSPLAPYLKPDALAR